MQEITKKVTKTTNNVKETNTTRRNALCSIEDITFTCWRVLVGRSFSSLDRNNHINVWIALSYVGPKSPGKTSYNTIQFYLYRAKLQKPFAQSNKYKRTILFYFFLKRDHINKDLPAINHIVSVFSFNSQ